MNWSPYSILRLQLNYIAKETESDVDPDLADDVICLNAQFSFGASLAR